MKIIKRLSLILIILVALGGFLIIHIALPKLLISTKIGFSRIELPKDAIEHQELTCTSFDDLKLKGLYFKPQHDSLHKTVIMLHGIRSEKEYYYAMAERLVNKGVSVLLIDHRAHGKSDGTYCTFGVKEKRDVKAWVDVLIKESPEHTFGVWGQSLGGAIGLQATAYDKRIKFAVIESTFANLKTIGPDYIHRMFGIKWDWLNTYIDKRAGIIGDFDTEQASPEKACKTITQPILMAHGNQDKNINIKYGKANFEALQSADKKFIAVDNAGHNTVWRTAGENYFDTVFSFILSH